MMSLMPQTIFQVTKIWSDDLKKNLLFLCLLTLHSYYIFMRVYQNT